MGADRIKQKIREHLAYSNLPMREIAFDVPDAPDVRAKIERFANEHVQRHAFVLRRADWFGSKLLAGLTAVQLGDVWRVTATMVDRPTNVRLPLSILPIDEVLRSRLSTKGEEDV